MAWHNFVKLTERQKNCFFSPNSENDVEKHSTQISDQIYRWRESSCSKYWQWPPPTKTILYCTPFSSLFHCYTEHLVIREAGGKKIAQLHISACLMHLLRQFPCLSQLSRPSAVCVLLTFSSCAQTLPEVLLTEPGLWEWAGSQRWPEISSSNWISRRGWEGGGLAVTHTQAVQKIQLPSPDSLPAALPGRTTCVATRCSKPRPKAMQSKKKKTEEELNSHFPWNGVTVILIFIFMPSKMY